MLSSDEAYFKQHSVLVRPYIFNFYHRLIIKIKSFCLSVKTINSYFINTSLVQENIFGRFYKLEDKVGHFQSVIVYVPDKMFADAKRLNIINFCINFKPAILCCNRCIGHTKQHPDHQVNIFTFHS